MTRHTITVWSLRVGTVVLVLAAWVYANTAGGVSRLLLPDIGAVVAAFGKLAVSQEFFSSFAVSFMEIVGAFLLAVAGGTLIGFWGARSKLRTLTIEPVLLWGYMAPLILFYPLFMLWFGIGPSSKVGFAAVSTFFPIAYTSLRAFRGVDERYLKVARAFGATRSQTDWLIKFRAALPMVMSGVRVGAATTVITVILAEMLASTGGLGYMLARESQTFAIAGSFAVILGILVVVAIFQLVIGRVFPKDPAARRT